MLVEETRCYEARCFGPIDLVLYSVVPGYEACCASLHLVDVLLEVRVTVSDGTVFQEWTDEC